MILTQKIIIMKVNSLLLVLLLLSLVSCSNDDGSDQPKMQTCDLGQERLLYVQCCVEGPMQARPGQIITVAYSSNFDGFTYDWWATGNKLELVEGQNTTTAKFKVLANFQQDTIYGYGSSANGFKACQDRLVILAY